MRQRVETLTNSLLLGSYIHAHSWEQERGRKDTCHKKSVAIGRGGSTGDTRLGVGLTLGTTAPFFTSDIPYVEGGVVYRKAGGGFGLERTCIRRRGADLKFDPPAQFLSPLKTPPSTYPIPHPLSPP